MTKEEVVTVLKDISWQMGSVKRWENIEAIDMAIEALSDQINCVKCEHYYEEEEDSGVEGHCELDTAHLSERTGEWITDMEYAGIKFYRCDQCEFRQSEKSRYCPSCGARMYKGGEEDD